MSGYRSSFGGDSLGPDQKSLIKTKKKGRAPPPPPASDSDQSVETNSLSAESQDTRRSPNDVHKSTSKKGEWEILEGLKEGQRFELVPRKFEGYLLKRRKWPLKGWHKRFFVLDQSVLVYSKSAADLARGKKHGSMDIGMSVISTKTRRRRIDIDADSNIYHLKCKSVELYLQWVEQLKQHRLHKQHQLLYSKNKMTDDASSPDDSPTGTLNRDVKQSSTGVVGGSLAGAGTLRSWLVDSSGIDHLGRDIDVLQQHLCQLSAMIDTLDDVSQGEPATPSTKKRGKFRLRKNKSNKSTGSAGEVLPIDKSPNKVIVDSLDCISPPALHVEGNLVDLRPLSSSNPALSLQSGLVSSSSSSRPHSCSDANSTLAAPTTPCPPAHTPTPSPTSHHCTPLLGQQTPAISLDARYAPPRDNNNRVNFSRKAKQIVQQMNFVLRCLHVEKEKARQAFESEATLLGSHSATSIIATLRNSLNQALQQNAELRGRLLRIHEDSNLSEVSMPPTTAEMD